MIPSKGGRLPRDLSRSLQHAHDQLLLPWLCPAINTTASRPSSRPRVHRRGTANTAAQRPPALRAHTSPASAVRGLRPAPSRQYAYAAPTPLQGTSPDDFYVPIESDPSSLSAPWAETPDMNFFDGSDPLLLEVDTKTREQRYKPGATPFNANDLRTIHQNLEACLTVGMYHRAALTLRHMNLVYRPEIEEIVGLNNFYIGHMLGLHITTGDPSLLSEVAKWYHVDMLKQGIQPNASTYALMLQVAMRDPERNRAARSVRRFANAASEAGVLQPVLEELQNVVPPDEYEELAQMAPYVFGDGSSNVQESESAGPEGYGADVVGNDMSRGLTSTVRGDSPEKMPYMLQTEQKGSGLETLRQSLATFLEPEKDHLRAEGARSGPEAEAYEINKQRQLRMEQDARLAALKKWQEDMEDAVKKGIENPMLQTNPVQNLIGRWHKNLVPLLREKLAAAGKPQGLHTNPHKTTRPVIRDHMPYLSMLNPDKCSITTIMTVLHTLASDRAYDWVPVVRVCMNIGRQIEREVAQQWVDSRKLNRFVKANMKRRSRPRAYRDDSARVVYRALQNVVPQDELPLDWTKDVLVKVGASLLETFLRIATLDPKPVVEAGSEASKYVPAFTHRTAFMRGRKQGVIVGDPELTKLLTASPNAAWLTKHLPMLVPPKPWTGFSEGGYLSQRVPVARLQQDSFQSHEYVKVAVEQGDMKTALQGLDTLGRVPWKVNKEVFDVMLKIWNSGEKFGKMPAANPVLEIPEAPPEDAPLLVKIKHYRAMKEYNNKMSGFHSERCFQNFQIETARAFLNDVFYLPHNIDFRGRAYPLSAYFNQMGSDNCRGLLMFAKAKPLGARGFRWLKIHMANLYGYDKASLDERQAFTEEHLDDILDSADAPLDGRGWWKHADDPWQCLATCFEIRNACRSADPARYECSLPVHQDGTCNGLQHYAALGGDEIGAKQVNLEPGDRPSDIYTAVADHVRESVAADAALGHEIALFVKDSITRKVVKQPVMTSVYGVTPRGAQGQIARQLDDLMPPKLLAENNNRYRFSSYISLKTFDALSALFSGAAGIQKWLGECVDVICRSVAPDQVTSLRRHLVVRQTTDSSYAVDLTASCQAMKKQEREKTLEEYTRARTPMIWTTPLRIPVVQPYRKDAVMRVPTELQDVSLNAPGNTSMVDRRKQHQAFAPNYIHSLDATHMLLSAQRCEEAGLTFSAVHDSFWTHASDIDEMNVILRDAFVQMHSEDVVGRLASEFSNRYRGHFTRRRVKTMSPLGRRIVALRKLSSIPQGLRDAAELALESERQRLLTGGDPELMKQGEAMMTPSRLCEEAAETDWEIPEGARKVKKGKAKAEDDTAVSSDVAEEDALEDEHELGQAEGSVAEAVEAGSGDTKRKLIPVPVPDDQLHPDDMEMPEGYFDLGKVLKKPRTKKPPPADSTIECWVPMTFSSIPEKGKWDVSRLRQSKYFFS